MAKSKFQKFDVIEIERKDLKKAPYNPRRISAGAKRRLKERLSIDGLVTPIIMNARTGNIVSGHQRISILDDLEGTKDYSLDIAVIDVESHVEQRLNVFLNNKSSQGEWDNDRLMAMLTFDEDVKLEDLGFDMKEEEYINNLLDKIKKESEENDKFIDNINKETEEIYNDIREISENFIDDKEEPEEEKKTRKERWLETVENLFPEPPPKPPEEDVPNEKYRETRESWKNQKIETDIVLKIIFNAEDNYRKFITKNGIPDKSIVHEKEFI